MKATFRLPIITDDHMQQIEARLKILRCDGFISGYDRKQKMIVIATLSSECEIQNIQITFPIDEVSGAAVAKIFNPLSRPCIHFVFEPTTEDQS